MSDLDYGRADVLASSMENGDVRVNLGDALTNEGYVADAPWWCSGDGFVSRPNNPSDNGGGSCVAFWFFDGSQRVAVAARDGRYAEKAGSLQPGDRAIVSDCDARFVLKRETNSVTLYTANETDDDNSQMIDLRGKTGVTLLLNGGCMIRQKKDEVLVTVQDDIDSSTFIQTAGGFQFSGKTFAVNCATITLGLMPPGIPPNVAVTPALVGLSGIAGIPSTKVAIAV